MVTTNLRNLPSSPVDTARTDTRQQPSGPAPSNGGVTRRVSMGQLSGMPSSFNAHKRAGGGAGNRSRANSDGAAAAQHHAAAAPHAQPLQFVAEHAPALPGSADVQQEFDMSALGPMNDESMIALMGQLSQHMELPVGVDPVVGRTQMEMMRHITQRMSQVQNDMVKNLEKAKVKDEDEDN